MALFGTLFLPLQHLASVLEPNVKDMTVLEYFTRQLDKPHMVQQIIQVSANSRRLRWQFHPLMLPVAMQAAL